MLSTTMRPSAWLAAWDDGSPPVDNVCGAASNATHVVQLLTTADGVVYASAPRLRRVEELRNVVLS
jgi:hypothetical protein